MRYCIDIDSTICTPGECGTCRYEGSKPMQSRIDKLNYLYDEGHYIIYFTARAMGRSSALPYEEAKKKAEDLFKPLTEAQLKMWGCKYHELIMGKPHADIFIDDKAMNSEDYFEKTT